MPKFSVQKSIHIHSDPQTVYQRVADFRTWPDWSPWLCAEPTAKLEFTETTDAEGSSYSWEGNVVGAGELEHKSLDPGKSIRDEIRFFKPMKSVSNVGFDFKPTENGTEVSWMMDGSLPFFLFWMTKQIETFIGMDYERGLKMLKESIETGRVASATTVHGNQQMGPFYVLGVRASCPIQEVGPSMDESFRQAAERLSNAGLPADGEKVSVYHKMDMKAEKFEYTSGMLFTDAVNAPEGMELWSLPQTDTFRVDHVGSYDHLGNAWSAAMRHVEAKRLKKSKISPFELYKNDPHDTAPEHLHTEIYLPLK